MTSSNITLSDNRVLCIHEFGDPKGRPIFFFHGSGLGATGLFAASCDKEAQKRHLRVLAPDRPGLGGSTPKSGRSVLDWTDDVAQSADALRLGSFPVIAHSGGACYALACAWKLRDRISCVRLSSAMASRPIVTQDKAVPFAVKAGTWFTAAMPRWVFSAMFKKIMRDMHNDPEKAGQAFLSRLPDCERPVLATADNQANLRTCLASALRQGTTWAIDDLHLILGEWGVVLKEVTQPVILWHGQRDSMASPHTAVALARLMPAAELKLVPQAGHLSTWLCCVQDVLASV
jgi:pimeloyl-ACP methyl ester carboxylesterase